MKSGIHQLKFHEVAQINGALLLMRGMVGRRSMDDSFIGARKDPVKSG
jgi:hypothetical protein